MGLAVGTVATGGESYDSIIWRWRLFSRPLVAIFKATLASGAAGQMGAWIGVGRRGAPAAKGACGWLRWAGGHRRKPMVAPQPWLCPTWWRFVRVSRCRFSRRPGNGIGSGKSSREMAPCGPTGRAATCRWTKSSCAWVPPGCAWRGGLAPNWVGRAAGRSIQGISGRIRPCPLG